MTEHEYLTNFAPEALALDAANAAEDYAAQDKALAEVIAAKHAAAVKAMEAQRRNPEAHESADINATEMVIETGVNPDGDAGRLLYLRAYVAALNIA